MAMTPDDKVGKEPLEPTDSKGAGQLLEPVMGSTIGSEGTRFEMRVGGGEFEDVDAAKTTKVAAQVEAVLAPKKPGIRLYGEGSKSIKRLEDVTAAMAVGMDIEFPSADLPRAELLEARSEIVSKLYELATATFEGLKDAKGSPRLKNEVPAQGQVSTGYSGADIEALTDDMDRLVKITDPNFNEAVAHKELGVIALLKMVIDAINSNGDPQAVFIAFRNLGLRVSVGARYPLGTEQVARKEFATMGLTELSWEGESPVLSRKNVLQERVDENFKYPEYSRIVAGDMKVFQQKFGAQLGLLRDLMQSMSTATRVVHTSRYFNIMWQYKIMHELTNEAPFMTAPMIDALKALGAEFDDFAKSFSGRQGLPETKLAMDAIVEKFSAGTMTQLVAAAKAAHGVMEVVAGALSRPNSVAEVQEILRKLVSEQLPAFADELGGKQSQPEAKPEEEQPPEVDEKKTTLALEPEVVL